MYSGGRNHPLQSTSQKRILEDYAEQHDFTNCIHFTDDGISGTQFDRPGFQKMIATVYKGNIIKNLIMDCQSYTKYRPNETTGGIFVSWRRKEELPTGV